MTKIDYVPHVLEKSEVQQILNGMQTAILQIMPDPEVNLNPRMWVLKNITINTNSGRRKFEPQFYNETEKRYRKSICKAVPGYTMFYGMEPFLSTGNHFINYMADINPDNHHLIDNNTVRSGVQMPVEKCRLNLMVKRIEVKRINEITDTEAMYLGSLPGDFRHKLKMLYPSCVRKNCWVFIYYFETITRTPTPINKLQERLSSKYKFEIKINKTYETIKS